MSLQKSLILTLTSTLFLAAGSLQARSTVHAFNPQAPEIEVDQINRIIHIEVPKATLRETVTFRAAGIDFDKSMMRAHPEAFAWVDADTLRVDLHPIYRNPDRVAHAIDRSGVWVWGQLRSGEALLQPVIVK